MDYRQRCYKVYGLQWEQIHSSSKSEFELYAKKAKKTFLTFLPLKKSAKIIDVACGAGHFLYFLKREGYTNVHGIDLSRDQLDIARKMEITEVEEAELFEYLSKFSGEYEMIIGNYIIEHLRKDETLKFLDALYRVLQPGGKVLISTDNSSSLFGAAVPYIDFTHEQGFTLLSLTQVLNICGFVNIKIYGDKPAVYDFRSLVRAWLWRITKIVLKLYLIIERGTGRGLWKNPLILEPQMFAIAQKPLKIA
jgi:2-polyprenyl-3-methyl-5-hydroxy-6-metoxy-1,4-benzoquinol methylase